MASSDDPFMDTIFEQEPHETTVYRTTLTTYEESLINGQYVGRGWNGAGYVNHSASGVRVDPSNHPVPEAFLLTVDGQSLNSHWELIDRERTDNGDELHTVVELQHMIRPIRVRVHTTLDGTAVLTRWLEITNDGSEPAAISEADPLSGVLQSTGAGGNLQFTWGDTVPDDEPLYSIGYMEGDTWGYEGLFQWHTLPETGYRIDGRYRRDRHRHPMFLLRNNGTGEHFICQLAWSGGYAFEFDLRTGHDGSAHLTFNGGPDAPTPLRIVEPGEVVESPTIHIGMTFGGLDESIQAMHDHLRDTVLSAPTRDKGCWVESGVGPQVEITPENVFERIERSAELGAEVFFIDAGWYVPLAEDNNRADDWYEWVGDWEVAEDRFPEGLDPIREKVYEYNMLFGLWMDVERVGEKSRIAQEHPEWLATPYDEESDLGGMLDLANPTVVEWVEGEITRTIETHDLDFFRLDYNVGNIGPGSQTTLEDYVENDYWRYYENVYDMYARLRERFPGVIFENCASGGGRTDIGQVQHFDHTWVTDWMTAPRSFAITNGMTMALPPEYIDRLPNGHNGHQAAQLEFQLRQMLFGRPTCGDPTPNGSDRNRQQSDQFKHHIELYKEFVRPFIRESRVYHHTPVFDEPEPQGWGALEMAAEDCSRAIAGVFQLSNPEASELQFKFRGLDIAKQYELTFDNTGQTAEFDGSTLMNDGVSVTLEGPLTSELLLVDEV